MISNMTENVIDDEVIVLETGIVHKKEQLAAAQENNERKLLNESLSAGTGRLLPSTKLFSYGSEDDLPAIPRRKELSNFAQKAIDTGPGKNDEAASDTVNLVLEQIENLCIQDPNTEHSICRRWINGAACSCSRLHGIILKDAEAIVLARREIEDEVRRQKWQCSFASNGSHVVIVSHKSVPGEVHLVRALSNIIAFRLKRSACSRYEKGQICCRPSCLQLHGIRAIFRQPDMPNISTINDLNRATKKFALKMSSRFLFEETVSCARVKLTTCAFLSQKKERGEAVLSFYKRRFPCREWNIQTRKCGQECEGLHGVWLRLAEALPGFRGLAVALVEKFKTEDANLHFEFDKEEDAVFVYTHSIAVVRELQAIIPRLKSPTRGFAEWLEGRRGWKYAKDFTTKEAEERLEGICKHYHESMKGSANEETVLRRLFAEEVDDRIGRNPQRLPTTSGNYQTKVLYIRKFLEYIVWFCSAILQPRYRVELAEVLYSCCGKSIPTSVADTLQRRLCSESVLSLIKELNTIVKPPEESSHLLRSSRQGPDGPCQWSGHAPTNPFQFTLVTNETQAELADGLEKIIAHIINIKDHIIRGQTR